MEVNAVVQVGNLGADAVLKSTSNGKVLAEFRIAVSEQFAVNGQQTTNTQWVPVECFAPAAYQPVLAGLLKKGVEVRVEGRLLITRFTDSAGIERFRTTVRTQARGISLVLKPNLIDRFAVVSAAQAGHVPVDYQDYEPMPATDDEGAGFYPAAPMQPAAPIPAAVTPKAAPAPQPVQQRGQPAVAPVAHAMATAPGRPDLTRFDA